MLKKDCVSFEGKEDETMSRLSTIRKGWNCRAMAGALGMAVLFLPAAATPATAAHDEHDRAKRHGAYQRHDHGRKYDRGHRYDHDRRIRQLSHRPRHARHAYSPYAHGPRYKPIRVVYRRPHVRPVYHYLPSPYVLFHGRGVTASVLAYPASAPVVYEPGYCPAEAHFHPYVPEPGLHGRISIRIGF